MTYQSVNPHNGKVLRVFDELGENELDAAIAVAANCFETWRRKTFAERSVVVAHAAAIMWES